MAKYSIEDTTLTAIADTIRAQGADAGRTIGQETPLNFPVVIDVVCGDQHNKGWNEGKIVGEQLGYGEGYDDGEEDGYTIGYADGEDFGYIVGFSDGEQSEYQTTWNSASDNVSIWNYSECMFSGRYWNATTFRPNKNLQPTYAYMMFKSSNINVDLVEHLANLGVTLDFSKATNMYFTFNTSQFTRIGVVDISSATNAIQCFAYSPQLHTIDHLIFKNDGNQTITDLFKGCTALKNITLSGVIGNDINFQDSPLLTKASITSIFDALSKTATGKFLGLSLQAVNKAFESAPGADDGLQAYEFITLTEPFEDWGITII